MFTRESKIILLITGLSHFAVHFSMLIFPAVRLVLKQEFGADLDILGWVGGLSGFMFGLGAIPTGWLERKVGGRILLIVCQLGLMISGCAVLLSQSLTQLIVALFFIGLFASIYHPAGLTLISRRIHHISQAMAYHGIAGSMGLGVGWVLASWFAANASWRLAYGSISLLCLILSVATAIFIPSRRRSSMEEEVTYTEVTKIKPLVIYYTIAVLVGLTFYGLNYLPVHFNKHSGDILSNVDSIFRNGLLTTLVFMAGVGGQFLGGKMGEAFDRTRLLPWILLGNVPLLVAIGYTNNLWLLMSAICVGITHFAFQPVGNSLIAQYTKSPSRGLGYGVSFFLSFGAGSIAEPIGGFLAVNYGVERIFILMAMVLLLAFALSLYLKRIS